MRVLRPGCGTAISTVGHGRHSATALASAARETISELPHNRRKWSDRPGTFVIALLPGRRRLTGRRALLISVEVDIAKQNRLRIENFTPVSVPADDTQFLTCRGVDPFENHSRRIRSVQVVLAPLPARTRLGQPHCAGGRQRRRFLLARVRPVPDLRFDRTLRTASGPPFQNLGKYMRLLFHQSYNERQMDRRRFLSATTASLTAALAEEKPYYIFASLPASFKLLLYCESQLLVYHFHSSPLMLVSLT